VVARVKRAAGLIAAWLVLAASGVAVAQQASPACVRENGCSVPACYPTITGTTYYVCDCATSGAAGAQPTGQQPAAGCTGGNDGLAGTSPATAWRTYGKAQGQFASLNAGDAILFCNGGTWDLTGASSYRWVNRNSSAGNRVVLAAYTATWGTGPRPLMLDPLGTYAFNFDDGSDIARGGYIVAGIAIQGLGKPATPCASSAPFPMEAFFIYNNISNVKICDVDEEYLCIGAENAGGNANDDDMNIVTTNTYVGNNGAQGYLGGGTGQIITKSYYVNNGFETANLDHHIYISSNNATGMQVTSCELYKAAQVGGHCSGATVVNHGLTGSLTIAGLWIHEDAGNATGSCYGLGINPGYTSFEGFSNVIINGNAIENVGGAAVDLSACHNCTVENTICLAAPTSGFECVALTNDGQGSGGGDWDNQSVAMINNTGYGNGTSFSIRNTGTLMSSYNNVTFQTATGSVPCFNYALATNAQYSGINNNWCFTPNGTGVWNQNGSQSLTTWRTNGWDLNSTQNTNPSFVNARISTTFAGAIADFTPAVSSPLIGAGNVAGGATTDFNGKARPPTAIGAVEPVGANTTSLAYYKWGVILLFLSTGLLVATLAQQRKRRRRGLTAAERIGVAAGALEALHEPLERFAELERELAVLERDE